MGGLSMGAYGAYVWTCFGLTLAVLLVNEWRVRARQQAVARDIEVRLRAMEDTE